MSQKFRDPKKPPGSKKFDPWSSCTAPVQHTAATWLSPAATSQAKMGKVTWLRTAFRSWLSVNLVAYTSLLGGHRSPNECLLYQWWVDRRQFQMNMICFYPQQGVWRSTWSYSKNPIKRKYKFGMGMIQFQILNTNISPSKLPPINHSLPPCKAFGSSGRCPVEAVKSLSNEVSMVLNTLSPHPSDWIIPDIHPLSAIPSGLIKGSTPHIEITFTAHGNVVPIATRHLRAPSHWRREITADRSVTCLMFGRVNRLQSVYPLDYIQLCGASYVSHQHYPKSDPVIARLCQMNLG